MKRLVLITGILLAMTGCRLFTSEIDGTTVRVDEATQFCTDKKSGKPITGTVIYTRDNPRHKIDRKAPERYKQAAFEVRNGKKTGTGYEYYPNGNIRTEYPYADGLVSGTVISYYPGGEGRCVTSYQKNKKHGTEQEFRQDGTQSREARYESGALVAEYEFDRDGNKIVSAAERLELTGFDTGFYEYIDMNSTQVLYQPMVIMKLKNISDAPLSERIKIEGVFISNDEELSSVSDYFTGIFGTPLQPGLTKQCTLRSRVGYPDPRAITGAKVSCRIYINGQLFKTTTIQNKYLHSNRIQ